MAKTKAEPVLDTDHLDSYAWNFLKHSDAAEDAASEMREAMDDAGSQVHAAVTDRGEDPEAAVDRAIRDHVEDLMIKYSKFGANDTEPRFVARDLLLWYAKELIK